MSLCKKGNLKDLHGCWEIAQRNKWLPGLVDCKALVGCLCQQEMLVEALQLLECMLLYNPHLGLVIFSAFLETHCVGFTGVVHLLLDEILRQHSRSIHSIVGYVFEGLLPEAEIYNMLKQGHCQVKNKRKVEELLATGNGSLVNKILDELQEKELQANEVTYNFLVYGFSECKDVSSTVHWLSMMISNEIRPSNWSLRAVISSLCNVGDLGKALQLSQEMESRGWTHGSNNQNAIFGGPSFSWNLKQSINTSGMLIHAFCQNGQTAEAEDFLISMLQVGESPTREMYSTVINRYHLEDNLKKASELMQVMQQGAMSQTLRHTGLL
ncbi:hypothetical protein CMV_020533 [Castanea mollissima]|uniref:Pentatricopeptide repeat-containing protein n=1 Tax=Castanea mollissima TaxID=60419 RepID=A0A8J4QYT8_9ROSI|nr:hypothetical protein CMV_020533 [Castanea mollissima]